MGFLSFLNHEFFIETDPPCWLKSALALADTKLFFASFWQLNLLWGYLITNPSYTCMQSLHQLLPAGIV